MSQPPQYPQYPNQQYPNPQYPPTVPPPGYPQPSNMPPGQYPPQGWTPPAPGPGTSVSAVFSLVLGILGCIPVVTSALAVLLGMVGISATKKGRKGGRGLAVAGLILGLLGVLLWGLFGGVAYTFWRYTGPARDAGHQFVSNLVNGKVDDAYAQCTSDITKDEVEAWSKSLKAPGTVTNVVIIPANVNSNNGAVTVAVGGVIQYGSSQRQIALILDKQNEVWKVSVVKLDTPVGAISGPNSAGAIPQRP